jgi:hypothetical protein
MPIEKFARVEIAPIRVFDGCTIACSPLRESTDILSDPVCKRSAFAPATFGTRLSESSLQAVGFSISLIVWQRAGIDAEHPADCDHARLRSGGTADAPMGF